MEQIAEATCWGVDLWEGQGLSHNVTTALNKRVSPNSLGPLHSTLWIAIMSPAVHILQFIFTYWIWVQHCRDGCVPVRRLLLHLL